MEDFEIKNRLDEIPKIDYSGYYWMSDQETPCLVSGKFEPNLSGSNPFIIEGNLFAEDGSCSVSIEHIDGEYKIGIITWALVDKSVVELEKQSYLAHKIDGISKVKLKRAWIPKPDPECAGMDVLQPAWRAFVGFEK